MTVGIQEIIDKVLIYDSHADLDLLNRAYQYASQAHRNQKRNSGEPYIIHPLEVASILADIEMDVTTLCAALLHDVVEDTETSYSQLKEEFGDEIALLVDGVTKLNRINFRSREEAQAENLRKMFIAMAKDIRVVIIKLADRLHNMRTLKYQPPWKQKEIARETLDIFAPLAHRIGIFRFKWELEDLAFSYLEPEIYKEIAIRLKQKRREREEYVKTLKDQIRQALLENNIFGDIAGRPKNIYSIYKKMLKQNKTIDEIYDKIAIRVIVDEVKDCYEVLGIIHTIWKPIPGRFKDYISTPKPNMYQSLHTTVIGQEGEPFEVQIRTWEMHRTSEYGIAAHWRYKEGGSSKDKKFDEKLAWLRGILEWQQDVNDTREFMESLKIDLFDDTVFAFTPKGDVIELPKGSCPVDFAYRVHTEVGHHCTGAKINGRIVPLDFPINNGDIVTILTSKNSVGPSHDWLNFVKTSAAKGKIKQWFKKEKRAENLIKGRDALERVLKKNHLNSREMMQESKLLEVSVKLGVRTVDDLYVAIADGQITSQQVVNKLKELFLPDTIEDILLSPGQGVKKTRKDRETSALKIRGVDDVAIRLAHCCNPLPGDMVKGYITRGRGVSVHRLDCPNLKNHLEKERDRIIDVEWAEEEGTYLVELEVLSMDRPRLTLDMMNIIADSKIRIVSIFSRVVKNNQAVTNIKLEVKDMNHLNAISQRIEKIKDVMEVKRV